MVSIELLKKMLDKSKRRRESFERLKETDPAAAKAMALEDLQAAGILDKNGDVTELYHN